MRPFHASFHAVLVHAVLVHAVLVVAAVAALSAALVRDAHAQVQQPPARSPCSLLSGRPCHPSFCGLFHGGPCFPQYLPPIGQDLRLTIESNDDNDPATKPDANADTKPDAKPGEDHDLDSIGAMYAALRACWIPPPKDEARHGMQYSVRFSFKRDGDIIAPPRVTYASHDAPPQVRDVYRDAVNATLERCTPLHFANGMGGAVAGRPIAIRFVDNRTINTNANARGAP